MNATQSINSRPNPRTPNTPFEAISRNSHHESESTTYAAITFTNVSTDHRHKNTSKDQAHPRITILWCPSRALAGPLGRASRATSKIVFNEGETS